MKKLCVLFALSCMGGFLMMILKAVGILEADSSLYLKGSAICWSSFILIAAFIAAEEFSLKWSSYSTKIKIPLFVGSFFMTFGLLLLFCGLILLAPILMQIFNRDLVAVLYSNLTMYSIIGGGLLTFTSMVLFPLLQRRHDHIDRKK